MLSELKQELLYRAKVNITKNGKYLKTVIFVIFLWLVVMKGGWMEDLISFLDTYLQIFTAKSKLVFISPSVL